MSQKILQIIPAPPDMWTMYKDECFLCKASCLALVEDNAGNRSVRVMDMSKEHGVIGLSDPSAIVLEPPPGPSIASQASNIKRQHKKGNDDILRCIADMSAQLDRLAKSIGGSTHA